MSSSATPRSSRVRQLSLEDSLPTGSESKSRVKQGFTPRVSHGGSESVGKRKTTRPFTSQAPLHLVLKSDRAKGAWSMMHRKHQSKITSMVYVYAHRFQVKVYRFANVGNQLHLLVKAEDRKALADYLRVLAGRVAVTVTGAQKHIKRVGKFWNHLCWSRLVKWGAEFHRVHTHLFSNLLEGLGADLKHFYPNGWTTQDVRAQNYTKRVSDTDSSFQANLHGFPRHDGK